MLDGRPVDASCPLPYDVPFEIGSFCLTLRQDRAAQPDWGSYPGTAPASRGWSTPALDQRPDGRGREPRVGPGRPSASDRRRRVRPAMAGPRHDEPDQPRRQAPRGGQCERPMGGTLASCRRRAQGPRGTRGSPYRTGARRFRRVSNPCRSRSRRFRVPNQPSGRVSRRRPGRCARTHDADLASARRATPHTRQRRLMNGPRSLIPRMRRLPVQSRLKLAGACFSTRTWPTTTTK